MCTHQNGKKKKKRGISPTAQAFWSSWRGNVNTSPISLSVIPWRGLPNLLTLEHLSLLVTRYEKTPLLAKQGQTTELNPCPPAGPGIVSKQQMCFVHSIIHPVMYEHKLLWNWILGVGGSWKAPIPLPDRYSCPASQSPAWSQPPTWVLL